MISIYFRRYVKEDYSTGKKASISRSQDGDKFYKRSRKECGMSHTVNKQASNTNKEGCKN